MWQVQFQALQIQGWKGLSFRIPFSIECSHWAPQGTLKHVHLIFSNRTSVHTSQCFSNFSSVESLYNKYILYPTLSAQITKRMIWLCISALWSTVWKALVHQLFCCLALVFPTSQRLYTNSCFPPGKNDLLHPFRILFCFTLDLV